jgi:hypothetical protein
MKWCKVLIIFAIVITQTGCAVYTVTNAVTWIATDKTLGDHALTATVPHSNCQTTQVLKGKYLCEINDPGERYNRTPF